MKTCPILFGKDWKTDVRDLLSSVNFALKQNGWNFSIFLNYFLIQDLHLPHKKIQEGTVNNLICDFS